MKRLFPLAVFGWAVAVTAIFALDHGGKPDHADAVVVLQGSKTRLPEGLKLVREGYAPLLVISRGDHRPLEAELCKGLGPAAVRVVCFTADPPSTRGEAEFIGRLAAKRHLARIDVVTSQFHVFRARILFERCYQGELHMVGSSQPAWKLPWYAVNETAKLVYQSTMERGC